jgi:hypothetical protein
VSYLREAHAELAEILEELGIECGKEVLYVWDDRTVHGYPALPPDALFRLGAGCRG